MKWSAPPDHFSSVCGLFLGGSSVTVLMSDVLSTQKVLLEESPVPTGEVSRAISVSALTRNSAVAMAGGVVSQGLKFLVIIYVARQLSVSQFGLISFAIAVSGYTLTLSNFGLPVFGSRVVANSGVVRRDLLAEIACLRACLAIAGTGLTLGFLFWIPKVSHLELGLVTVFGLSNIAQAGLFDWVFQGLHRQEISALLNIIWQGGWLGLTVVGMKLRLGLVAVPLALAGSGLIASGAGYFWLRRTERVLKGDRDQLSVLHRSWEILKRVAPLGWGTLLVTVLIWSDAVVVRLLRGEQAVGLYAAGNRAALALAMLSSFYVQGAFPLLSKASHESRLCLNRYFQQCYQDMALVFLPGSVWAVFYAPELILAVFKNHEYLAAVPIFRVFQLTFLFAALANLFGIGAIVATHRDKDYQRVLLLTSCVFIPLCVALTSYIGVLGASVAALFAQLFSLTLFLKGTRSLIKSNHYKAVLPPLAIGIVVGIISRTRQLSLSRSLIFLFLAYAFVGILRFGIPFRHQEVG